jgi:hypothetical protein
MDRNAIRNDLSIDQLKVPGRSLSPQQPPQAISHGYDSAVIKKRTKKKFGAWLSNSCAMRTKCLPRALLTRFDAPNRASPR